MPMDEFRISIGTEGLPSSIRFNGRHSIDVDWEGPVEISDRKIRPLLLLALLTEWKRSEGNVQQGNLRKRNDTLCPSLKPRNEKAAKSLSQALCDKRNYEDKSSKMENSGNNEEAQIKSSNVEPDTSVGPRQSPKAQFTENPMKKTGHWLKEIFGEWPLDKYLIANKTSGDVAFKKNVRIVIEEEFGSVMEDDPKKIGQLYYDYARSKNEIKVQIRLNLESNGDGQPTIIETDTCEGSFRTNAKFWIQLIANFETKFHVFWISPDISYIMYPRIEFPDIHEWDRNSFQLRIGEHRNIIIKPPTGIQTCVVLLNGQSLGGTTCKNILDIIEECIPLESRQGFLEKPELTKYRLSENTRGLAVQPEIEEILWQDTLANKLKGYGELLYVFSIPHL